MNRRGVSLAILVFAFASIALLLGSLVVFSLRDRDIDENLGVFNNVDKIYIKKIQLDYFLKDVFERSVGESGEDFVFWEGVEGFVKRFREEFGRLNVEGFEEVERYVNSDEFVESVELSEDKLILRFEVVLVKVNEMSLKYDYKRVFEKTFKV